MGEGATPSGGNSNIKAQEGIMDERGDPMALWVGDWTPEDVIDRETRRLKRPGSDERLRDERETADGSSQ